MKVLSELVKERRNIDGAGQENFEGELLQFVSSNFKDWKAVLDYLKNKHS